MKLRALLILFLAIPGAAWAQLGVPPLDQGLVDLQARTQLIANFGSFDVLAELLGQYRAGEGEFGYHDVTVGGYYRVLPNLKVGIFDRLQAGARHDDDVLPILTGPQVWQWAPTNDRLENVLMLDVSPRFLLPFLPGGNWVFMLKGRFLYSTYLNEMSILARPELTWFWMQDRMPLLNVSLSYEMYFPLNFGSSLIYESYPYLTLLWHVTPDWGIEVAGAYMTTVWSTSQSWAAAGGSTYSIPVGSWVASLGVVVTLGF